MNGLHYSICLCALVTLSIPACGPGSADESTGEAQTQGTDDDIGDEVDGDTSTVGVCGNGVIEDGELCDDGDEVDGDGCNSSCVPSGAERWRADVSSSSSVLINGQPVILEDGDIVLPAGGDSPELDRFLRFSPDGELLSTLEIESLPLAWIHTHDYVVLPDGGLVLSQRNLLEDSRLVEVSAEGELVRAQSTPVGDIARDGELWVSLLANSLAPDSVSFGTLDELFAGVEPLAELPESSIIFGVEFFEGDALAYGGSDTTEGISPAYWRVSMQGAIEATVFPAGEGEDEDPRWFGEAASQGDELRLVDQQEHRGWSTKTQQWEEYIRQYVPVSADGGWFVIRNSGEPAVDKIGPDGEIWYAIDLVGATSVLGVADGLELVTVEWPTPLDLVRYAP